MLMEGTVTNGVVVLDVPGRLPEGARVEITVKAAAKPADGDVKEEPPRSAKELLMNLAGCMTDLPNDLARNHDHYIHGTPKR